MSSQSDTTVSQQKPVKMADILGCWSLINGLIERDGKVEKNPNIGERPTGFLHYLPGGRVAVTVSMEDRGRMSVTNDDRRKAPMEELAGAARTFDAYAGRFSLAGPDRITHHIEVSLFQNDVGADFQRRVELDGDFLRLYPLTADGRDLPVKRWMLWKRLTSV